jgi:hypothetical protein
MWHNPRSNSYGIVTMSSTTGVTKKLLGSLSAWMARYFGWLFTTTALTLGGAAVLMLFKDWTIKSLFTSAMAWPALGLAMLAAVPIAFIPLGRIFFYTAFAAAASYHLILLIS